MKINEIIKEKRKELELTQEQVAEYLGVSTPAVSKWEKGSTYPDITILPSLARLLKVDLNTLLSFNDDLTEKEIGNFINKIAAMIQEKGYEIGFQTAMEKIQEYSTCDLLICKLAQVLDGALFIFGVDNKKQYEVDIEKLYERVADSKNHDIKNQANSMLIYKYMERKEYEKAQALLDSLPSSTFDKKWMQSRLYIKQEKLKEASELLESKLMTSASDIQSTLLVMMEIAHKENRLEDASYFADISEKTAKIFDLCEYCSYVANFQLSLMQKDAEKCISILKPMLNSMLKNWDINSSMLYKHIKTKNEEESVGQQMLPGLLKEIENDKEFDFLKSNEDFIKIMNEFKK